MGIGDSTQIDGTAAVSSTTSATKEWALDVISSTFSAVADLPAYEEGRSEDLAIAAAPVEENAANIEAAVRALGPAQVYQESVSTGPALAPARSGLHENAVQDLHRFIDEFGGAPNFGGQIPRRQPNSERFLGIPKETVQIWFSKGLKNYKDSFVDFVLHPIYFVGTKIFGISEPLSKFEYVAKHIEALAWLKANPDVIQQFSLGEDATARLGEVTGLTCHVGYNGSKTVAFGLKEHLDLFEKYYEHNKALGDDALKAFFHEAFDDSAVCFEARATHLNAYARAHPLGNEVIGPVKLDIAAVNIDDVYENHVSLLADERINAGIQGLPKVSDFNDFLVRTYGTAGVVGLQGKVLENGDLRSVTLTAAHHAAALDYLVNVICAVDPDDAVVILG